MPLFAEQGVHLPGQGVRAPRGLRGAAADAVPQCREDEDNVTPRRGHQNLLWPMYPWAVHPVHPAAQVKDLWPAHCTSALMGAAHRFCCFVLFLVCVSLELFALCD